MVLFIIAKDCKQPSTTVKNYYAALKKKEAGLYELPIKWFLESIVKRKKKTRSGIVYVVS